MSDVPKVTNIKKHAGIAGQFSVTATVQYPDEEAQGIEFVGSVYGGPVVMVTPGGNQMFVREPGRFGEFGTDWVRKFFE
jgi:hypothetical protein